ncbi:hypothetical protein Ciccas_004879 [Cichlidogyrus casuarinus]|uniref:Uncharacterized protein n=1 Tax=Cichlidogyrus casuarinus TaxID=1844966 RepID=A0ABD2QA85_9PLAT
MPIPDHSLSKGNRKIIEDLSERIENVLIRIDDEAGIFDPQTDQQKNFFTGAIIQVPVDLIKEGLVELKKNKFAEFGESLSEDHEKIVVIVLRNKYYQEEGWFTKFTSVNDETQLEGHLEDFLRNEVATRMLEYADALKKEARGVQFQLATKTDLDAIRMCAFLR